MRSLGYFVLNTLQALFLASWSALWISIAGVVSIFSGELPLVLARRCWATGLIFASLAEVRLEPGAELDPKAPYLFVMNHQSMYDVAVAFAVIPRNLRFVAKSVLKYVPFLGFFIWRTGMVFVDRSHPARAYENLGRAVQRLREGACFLAYPEGTRTMDGTIKSFKRGSFVTAIRAQAAVVPVAIEGSWHVLPRGGFNLRPGLVRVKIGAPVSTVGRTEDDAAELVREVRAKMIELHRSIGGKGGVEGSAVMESSPDVARAPLVDAARVVEQPAQWS